MGLDMHVYTAPKELVGESEVDLNELIYDGDGNHQEGVDISFAYWRKFNALHGWMNQLYIKKGGTDLDFNCNTVRLMPEDLDQLEQDIDRLVPVDGFFFGSQEPVSEEEKEEVRQFIKKSRQAIEDGLVVIYDSWW